VGQVLCCAVRLIVLKITVFFFAPLGARAREKVGNHQKLKSKAQIGPQSTKQLSQRFTGGTCVITKHNSFFFLYNPNAVLSNTVSNGFISSLLELHSNPTRKI